MKRIYKRLTAILLTLVLCFGINIYNPKADAYVSISATSSVSIGGGVTVSVSISGDNVSAYTLWVTYDSSVLQYNSGSGATINGGGGTVIISGTSTGTATLSFTAIANGSSGIYASGEVLSIEGDVINTSYGSASVTVSTPDTSGGGNSGGGNSGGDNSGGGNSGGGSSTQVDDRSSNCYLESLEVSHGTLDPEFSSDTYEYTLRVEEGVKDIAINAIPEDDEASTSVTGNNDLEPGENTVEIIVTAENGAVKKYTINVIVGEILEDVVINLNGMDFTIVNDPDVVTPPENFTKTTIKYDKWDVLAYTSTNEKITLMCLADEQDIQKWFIYDGTTGEFIEFKEYSSKYNRYIILPLPEDLTSREGFVLTEAIIFGSGVEAYKNYELLGTDKYLIYGMNLDGEEGYYIFDMVEKTFMRYELPEIATEADAIATVVDAKPEDENGFLPDFLTKSVLLYILCGIGALFLILMICLIAFGCKIGKLNRELDILEEENEKLTTWEKTKKKETKPAPTAKKIEEVPLEEDTKEDTNVENVVADEVSSEEAVTEEVVAEEVATEEVATEEVATEEVATEEVATKEINEDIKEDGEEIAESSVTEIPVVDLGIGISDESYDADKDSAF